MIFTKLFIYCNLILKFSIIYPIIYSTGDRAAFPFPFAA